MAVDQEILFQRSKDYADAKAAAELTLVHGLSLEPTKASFLLEAIMDVVIAKIELNKANVEMKK
jgi:hypothetical protein